MKVVQVGLTDPGRAVEVLALVDDLRRRALCDVVPAFPETTHALWERDLGLARSTWDGRFGEATDRWILAAVGSDFDGLLALPLRDDERSAATRLEFWAERIWGAFEATTGIRIGGTADAADEPAVAS